MEESDTYLMILEEGQEKQAKKDLLRFGQARLGPADESIKAQLDGVRDVERLDRMLHRLLGAPVGRRFWKRPEPVPGANPTFPGRRGKR